MKNHIKLLTGILVFAVAITIAAGAMPSATQATSSTCIDLTNVLKRGSTDAATGGQVTILQNFLKSLGYFTISPTGYFGTITQAALQSFQHASVFNGVQVIRSGITDATTTQAIKDDTCGSISTTSNIATTTCPTGFTCTPIAVPATITSGSLTTTVVTGSGTTTATSTTTSTATTTVTASSLVPLYLLAHAGSGDEILTTSAAEVKVKTAAGYLTHYVVGYIYSSNVSGTIPLYGVEKPGDHYYGNLASVSALVSSAGYKNITVVGYSRSTPLSSADQFAIYVGTASGTTAPHNYETAASLKSANAQFGGYAIASGIVGYISRTAQ